MSTIQAQTLRAWPVFGIHGQCLGTTNRCVLDVSEGTICCLELKTPWQTLEIEWPQIEFDETCQGFRLTGSKSARTMT